AREREVVPADASHARGEREGPRERVRPAAGPRQLLPGQRQTGLAHRDRDVRAGARLAGLPGRRPDLPRDGLAPRVRLRAGVGPSQAYGLSRDASGDDFVSGYARSSGFVAASTGSGGGDFDAFVIELDPSGSSALYSAYLGGDGDDEATAIALDSAGDAYVAG